MRYLCLLTLLILSAAATSTGSAQPEANEDAAAPGSDDAARDHFQTGLGFYEDARYEEALPEFEAAWELSQRPEMLFNIANAAERSFNYARAVSALEEYLELVPDANDQDVLRRRIVRNRTATESSTSNEREGDDDAQDSGASTLRLAGWLTIGGAGALGVASLITGLVSHGKHSDLQEVCQPSCPPERAGDIDSGRSLARASTVLSALALAAGIAGVVLVIVGRDDEDAESASLEVLPGLAGASVRVRY